ncbi:MAG: hypothetical protein KAS07_00675 [Candidatus Pacebacteria bacterium]|nr:hypothetical protein [Candidatus Paceibacterota bacterium]
MKCLKRLIVKFGTENLFGGNKHLSQEIFSDYARQIVSLHEHGTEIIIVSSGAIVAGRERLKVLHKDDASFSKKELASIGTRHLCNMWGDAFEIYGIDVALILVTYANWKDKKERQSIKKSIIGCCGKGIVPVVNENDVVSDEEILLMEKGFSENDRLARMTGVLVRADGVLFLTNVLGIYESDPKHDPKAKRFAEIDHKGIQEHKVFMSSSRSANGRGGIGAKVREAVVYKRKLLDADVVIAGNEENVIVRFAEGDSVGTRIGFVTKIA